MPETYKTFEDEEQENVAETQGQEPCYFTSTDSEQVNNRQMSSLQQQRLVVEQLRREAAIRRISVKQAVADLMKFVEDHTSEDYLLIGFSTQKANPFREKSSCSLL